MNRLIIILITLFSIEAYALCQCVCINGTSQAICERSIDLKPICPPKVCRIVTPSIKPINRPYAAPIGTKSCRQAQVYNSYTRRYEWKQVCS